MNSGLKNIFVFLFYRVILIYSSYFDILELFWYIWVISIYSNYFDIFESFWYIQVILVYSSYFDIFELFWYIRVILIFSSYFDIFKLFWNIRVILTYSSYFDIFELFWYIWIISIYSNYFDIFELFLYIQVILIYYIPHLPAVHYCEEQMGKGKIRIFELKIRWNKNFQLEYISIRYSVAYKKDNCMNCRTQKIVKSGTVILAAGRQGKEAIFNEWHIVRHD